MDIDSISVLLVELEGDDSIIRQSAQGTSLAVQWVASYQAALNVMEHHQHDIYLFNYNLDQYNGLALLQQVVLRGCQTPVILLIEPGSEIGATALKAGAADYLIKGQFDADLLQRSIRYAIERQEILAALQESEFRLESILNQAPLIERQTAPRLNEIVTNITKCLQDQEVLRLLESAVNYANESILITTAELELPGPQITFVNSAFTKATGYTAAEVIGKTPRLLQGPKTNRSELKRLRQCLAQGQEFCGENINYRKDGTEFYLEWHVAPIKNEHQETTHFVSIQRNITERKQKEAELRHRAFYDALTGLPNRLSFMNRLEQAIALAQRQDYSFAVLFLDLDRFKVINDSLGHLMGDQLLMETAQKLESSIRIGDLVARFGGDEFAILLDDAKIQEAVNVAERIQAELALPFNLCGQEVFTTATIGIALSVTGEEQPQDMLRNADTAMYQAKALGRARHQVFDPTMYSCALSLMQLETDLRRAIQRQEFRLYYQPIMSLKTNRLAGFEALIRWQHPERGLISPAEFIPIAEETGLIIPIGLWVIEAACRQMRLWQQQFQISPAVNITHTLPLTISINISAKQFSQTGLIQHIQRVLLDSELDASYLKLEITESVLMDNTKVATGMIENLKALGIQLAIDDFGTGFSSLSYLHRFPTQMLKVDRSFISRMDADKDCAEIIWTIITLAHNLGMKVIAEGIETTRQLFKLKTLQCEYGQGYFFAPPLNSEDAKAFIQKNIRFNSKTY